MNRHHTRTAQTADPRFSALAVVDRAFAGELSGGTGRYSRCLVDAAAEAGFRVLTFVDRPEPKDLPRLESPILVFVQEEGGLSREYKVWAEQILATGAWINEKNVFNLPSKFRPVHSRYIMQCTSEEGLHRWVLRSLLLWKSRSTRCRVLPNLIDTSRTSGLDSLSRRRWARATSEPPGNGFSADSMPLLRFYRQGRPARGKWSTFEPVFVSRCRELGSSEIQALARGVPDSLKSSYEDAGFTVKEFDSSREVLEADFDNSDVYLHSSIIGETLGVSILEAYRRGLFLVLGAEPYKEAGYLDYISEVGVVVGTESWLLRNCDEVVRCIIEEGSRHDRPQRSLDTRMTVGGDQLADLLAVSQASGSPSLLESLRFLKRRLARIHGAPRLWKVVLREVIYGGKRLVWRAS